MVSGFVWVLESVSNGGNVSVFTSVVVTVESVLAVFFTSEEQESNRLLASKKAPASWKSVFVFIFLVWLKGLNNDYSFSI